MFVACLLVWSGALYLGTGFLLSVVFLFRGLDRIDPSAKDAGIMFRLLMLPGLCMMWPYILKRFRHPQLPEERTAHKKMW